MNFKKSQSSLEFLLIFGISFTILVILGGVFLSYFNSEKNSLDSEYLQKIGLEMMQNVEKVYFLGYGNRITSEVKFPEVIYNISIKHYNNHTLNDGSNSSFDVLNITTLADGQYNTNLFSPNELYIRFNCTNCYHDYTRNISWFNYSDISQGFKRIRFESEGDFVAISFPKD